MFSAKIWLESTEPGVSKENIFFPNVCDQESHFLFDSFCQYLEIDVMSDHPPFIISVVYIE
jgi:hypothetical protein